VTRPETMRDRSQIRKRSQTSITILYHTGNKPDIRVSHKKKTGICWVYLFCFIVVRCFVFHITKKENGFAYFKDLELHTIELNKFIGDSSKELKDIVAKTRTALDMPLSAMVRHY
jgi:hypothetical protein